MGNSTDKQSLTSQIIKIMRTTTEPLSAHAISDIYSLTYSKVKKILAELKEDNLVYSIKTARGEFYFIPDKYFKRDQDLLSSEETMPFVWYEELSEEELNKRKETIVSSLNKKKKKYKSKKISSTEYFRILQEKNEELSIINQIIEDKRLDKIKKCFFCNNLIKEDEFKCSSCEKEIPHCSVCKRKIYANQSIQKCPKCNSLAHKSHIIEWLKTIGSCPICKEHILETQLIDGVSK